MKRTPHHREQGSATAPLLFLIGGVSLAMAYGEFKNVKSQSDQAKVESNRSFASQQNMSSLQMASRLLLPDKPGQIAPIYLDPYIQAGACDQNRKLNTNASTSWSADFQKIVIKNFSSDQLRQNSSNLFASLSQGQDPNFAPTDATNLRVLGFKCSDDATKPFLVEGVYVEAVEQQLANTDKSKRTKAFLALGAPPSSSCLFYVKESTGTFLPASKRPAKDEKISPTNDQGELYFECNHVITQARILDNGVQIATTNNFPLTAAHRIDPAPKVLLGPIKLADIGAGDHNLTAIASQVDGDQVLSQMIVSLAAPTPPPEENPNKCAYQCETLPGEVYPNLCDGKKVHKDYYQSQKPDVYVCYQCEKYIGFDPKKNCEPVGVVGNRGAEGCFAADTTILMEDKSQKAISELTVGDRIWNPILKQGMPIKKLVKGPEFRPLLQIGLGKSHVKVTRNHPFMTPLGLLGASELKVGDLIMSPSGTWEPVQSVIDLQTDPGVEVWNLEIATNLHDEAHHMLVTNGILSGDLYLQKRISSRNLLEMALRNAP